MFILISKNAIPDIIATIPNTNTNIWILPFSAPHLYILGIWIDCIKAIPNIPPTVEIINPL